MVTGGGSGIGFGLTERFVQENNTVIICGRREDALNAVKEKLPSVITRVCDLSREDERTALYSWIAADHPDLNVLLNNAGIQQWISVTDDDFYARTREEIETNVLACSFGITACQAEVVANHYQCYFRPRLCAIFKSSGLLRHQSIYAVVHLIAPAPAEARQHRGYRNDPAGAAHRSRWRRKARGATGGERLRQLGIPAAAGRKD